MEPTHYLPDEELKAGNYPEIVALKPQLDQLEAFASELDTALAYYNEHKRNKIDVDVTALQRNIDLCRSVCEHLSKAPKVCHDIIMDIRELQEVCQELLYARRRFGDEYVGTATEVTDDDIGGDI